jgi:ligand-binding sensor domain-containing protein/signal transduction histidine kinase
LRSLNTYREGGFGRRWLLRCAIAGLAGVCFAVSASAVDPTRTVSQYLHDSWGTERGLPGESITAIAQTSDGYLWIGTDKGLVRFDGLTFRQYERAHPQPILIGPVRTLLVDASDHLWILLQNTHVFRYHNGTFDLIRGETENGTTALARGASSAVLLSSMAAGILTYSDNRFRSLSSTAVLGDAARVANSEAPDRRATPFSWFDRLAAPTSVVISMAQTDDGKIWLGTEGRGLFYLQEGRVSSASTGRDVTKINCLLPLRNSELWVGTPKGVLRWNGTALTLAGVPSSLLNLNVLSLLRDRDSNTWVGTNHGLVRLSSKGTASFVSSTRLVGAPITALFEDREGNIWAGGSRGLERLRDTAFVTYAAQADRSPSVGPLYIDPNDHIWFAPIEGGLRRSKGTTTVAVQIAGLARDVVYSISGRDNDVWLARRRGGLTHLRYLNGSFVARSYTHADGLAQDSVYSVYVSRDGTVWAGTLSGGVSAVRNGHVTTYTTANGLASDTVSAIAEDTDGTMWFGTPSGLTVMSSAGWRTYSERDGLPSPDVNCLLSDSNGVLWIGTAAGLSWLTHDHIEVPREVLDSLREPIFGMAQDRNGWLWIATASHILRVKRNGLMGSALTETDVREYGLHDGLSGTEGVKRFQSVVKDSHGHVWFSTNRGLSVVNPAGTAASSAPALVHIEGVAGDGTALDLGGSVHFPPGTRRITFRYAGLSLSNSERVRYRYRLDGFDGEWNEGGTSREATYHNLGVGTYRFRVMASNSDGVWNGSEATVAFEVEPTLWQTWWFQLGCVVCAGLAAWLVYRLRVRRLTQMLKVGFEERLAERTRIARELHDTLLQSFLGVLIKFAAVARTVRDRPDVQKALEAVIEQAGQAIAEGRDAVQGLRSSTLAGNDLARAISLLGDELTTHRSDNHCPDFLVQVEGTPRELAPILRDDVYRIAEEAIRNAFEHAKAARIGVEIRYDQRRLRLRVRDDGKGIDPDVLQSGARAGHYGLPGVQERAKLVGGKVTVWSDGFGTEIELTIPASVVYASTSGRRELGKSAS